MTATLSACSVDDIAARHVANDYAKKCINSESVKECSPFNPDSQNSLRKYLDKKKLSKIDRLIAQAEARVKQEHLDKQGRGQEIVKRLYEEVNYYQGNCKERLFDKNNFDLELSGDHCIGNDLINGLFGLWGMESGRWKKAMFLTESAWEDLSFVEKSLLDEWLRDHNIRNIYVGRVVPSTKFNANTITIDRTVWDSSSPPIGDAEALPRKLIWGDMTDEQISTEIDLFKKCGEHLSEKYPCILTKSCGPNGAHYEVNECVSNPPFPE